MEFREKYGCECKAAEQDKDEPVEELHGTAV
jgi:hypothetical protein